MRLEPQQGHVDLSIATKMCRCFADVDSSAFCRIDIFVDTNPKVREKQAFSRLVLCMTDPASLLPLPLSRMQ